MQRHAFLDYIVGLQKAMGGMVVVSTIFGDSKLLRWYLPFLPLLISQKNSVHAAKALYHFFCKNSSRITNVSLSVNTIENTYMITLLFGTAVSLLMKNKSKWLIRFTFFKVKLSQLVHINFQVGENSHSYFFLCVEWMTEGWSSKVLLFEIKYAIFYNSN